MCCNICDSIVAFFEYATSDLVVHYIYFSGKAVVMEFFQAILYSKGFVFHVPIPFIHTNG